MQIIKQWLRGLVDLVKLTTGLMVYLSSKNTPAYAYQSMIRLFCMTSGYSSDLLSRVIGFFKRPYVFQNANGVLGAMGDKSERDKVVSVIREQGFYVFEKRLPEDLCARLLQYATSHSCTMRPMDGDQLGQPVVAVYQRGKPLSVRYDFDTQDLLLNEDVQKVMSDLSFAAIAQDYLGARPVIDVLGMWWHTDFSDKPDIGAAQYYHFDMDRPKWLKFFIYLTDVESANGPHTFVSGSHKSCGIPSSLLRKGYARLTDEEVSEVYDEKSIIEFCAPHGTIIAEDTRGLHKGKHVENGDRLIMQVQFSNSLFGGAYPRASLGKGVRGELGECLKLYPDLYAAYID